MQCYGRVSLGNAGGVSQVQANGDMGRNIGGKQGLFHMLSTEMRNSLLLVAREDREKIRKFDASALENQRAEKQRKEELLKEHGLEKASEAYIDGICYHEMYHYHACWRTSSVVDRELNKL